nr:probable inactive poly [ADP-ribose] polymerase SRO5 isoform X2 [Tanacetum cinerariifolium]
MEELVERRAIGIVEGIEIFRTITSKEDMTSPEVVRGWNNAMSGVGDENRIPVPNMPGGVQGRGLGGTSSRVVIGKLGFSVGTFRVRFDCHKDGGGRATDVVGEDDKRHGIIVNKFVAKLGEIRVKADGECVYRNMFGASLVSQAKEIDRIVGFAFGYGDVGNCEWFRNAIVLNADHSPFESVESAIVDDDGVKHILLCRVLLGKTEVVNSFSTQCYPTSEEFNSGVDNAVSPKKYIIWSSQMNTYILMEFVISFKTQRIANRPQVNGVRIEKPVSPWIPIPDLIAKLSKMLPPKSIKEITQYRHSYIQCKITRLDMIRGIKGISGDRMFLMVLKDFTEKRRVNQRFWCPYHEGW